MKHVTPQMVRQFLLSAAGEEEPNLALHEWAVPIGAHLFRCCDECLDAIHRGFAAWSGLDPDDPRLKRDAFEFLYRRGVPPEDLARQARLDADELLALGPSERRDRLAGEELRFRSPALVHELLERCGEMLALDAAGALELAALAEEISLRVDPMIVGNLAIHARARAMAHKANCFRLNDDTQSAQATFREAHELYDQATFPEPEIDAEISYLEASLATDQRRFAQGGHLLAHALEQYQRLNKPQAEAKTLIKRANLAYHRGKPGAGFADLEKAASRIKLEDEPQLHVTIRFSQALYAVEAGDAQLAQRIYREHRALLETNAEPWLALRLLWLRAKIARAEGELEGAVDLYSRVREGFLDKGLGYDAALVSLELAVLHLETGSTDAVRRLAAEMLPIFQAQDVHREALAALALFERTVREDELTVALALELQRYLRLAQRDSSFTYEEFRETDGNGG